MEDKLYVLVSQAKKELSLEWLPVTDSLVAQAQVSAGTNTLTLAAEIAQNIKSMLVTATELSCARTQRADKPVAKMQLQCSSILKRDAIFPLNSVFLSVGFCIMKERETCVEYIFTEGDTHCQHEFVQFYSKLNTVFYDDRTRRSLFSLYSLNEDAVAKDIILNKNNIMAVDTNMQNLQQNIIQYMDSIASRDTNFTLLFRRSGRYMIKSELHDAILMMTQGVTENHLAVVEYQRIIQLMMSHITGTVTQLATLSQGQSVCRTWDGRTGCVRDIPFSVCTPFDYQTTMRIESVKTQEVKKIVCVPCFAPSYRQTGLSTCNNHYVFSSTNDQKILLISNGMLIETGVKTDEYTANLNDLLLLHGCYFNMANMETILVSCKKQTSISDKDNQVYKLNPFQLVTLSASDFPIYISSYLISFNQVDESIKRKQVEMVTKSVTMPTMYSVDSLPYLLEDLEFEEMAKPVTFLSLIEQYEELKTPYIVGMVIIGVIGLIIVGFVIYKCWPCYKWCFGCVQNIISMISPRTDDMSTASDPEYGEERTGVVPVAPAPESQPMLGSLGTDKTTYVRPRQISTSVRSRAPAPPLYTA